MQPHPRPTPPLLQGTWLAHTHQEGMPATCCVSLPKSRPTRCMPFVVCTLCMSSPLCTHPPHAHGPHCPCSSATQQLHLGMKAAHGPPQAPAPHQCIRRCAPPSQLPLPQPPQPPQRRLQRAAARRPGLRRTALLLLLRKRWRRRQRYSRGRPWKQVQRARGRQHARPAAGCCTHSAARKAWGYLRRAAGCGRTLPGSWWGRLARPQGKAVQAGQRRRAGSTARVLRLASPWQAGQMQRGKAAWTACSGAQRVSPAATRGGGCGSGGGCGAVGAARATGPRRPPRLPAKAARRVAKAIVGWSPGVSRRRVRLVGWKAWSSMLAAARRPPPSHWLPHTSPARPAMPVPRPRSRARTRTAPLC